MKNYLETLNATLPMGWKLTGRRQYRTKRGVKVPALYRLFNPQGRKIDTFACPVEACEAAESIAFVYAAARR